MALSRIFTTEDTTLYSTWKDDIVVLFVPGIGEVRMTLAKAEEVSDDLARHAEYGRWAAMEERHFSKLENKNRRKNIQYNEVDTPIP